MHECASIVVTNLRVANTHAHLINDFEAWQKVRCGPQRIATRIRRYMNEGLEDLIRDVDVKFYLDGLVRGPSTLLFDDGKVRSISFQ